MNKKSFVWLIPVLVLAFALAGCAEDTGSGGGGGLATLNIPGEQVWTIDTEGAYVRYDGSDPLSSSVGGAGSIIDGKLTFSVGTPSQARLVPMSTFITSINDKFKIFSDADWGSTSPNAVEFIFQPISLTKANYSPPDATPKIEEVVRYIYVDTDCTLTAARKPNVFVEGVSIPVNVSALNLSLKKGWNIINTQLTITATGATASITTGDLDSCKWILTLYL